MKKKLIKKVLCASLLFIMGLSVVSTTNTTAYSAYNDPADGVVITQSDYTHPIKNESGATGVGGLSVCDGSNKLYVLKAKSVDDTAVVLYYYENAYDMNSYAAKIVFQDSILGHANGMAIDDEFLYVTMWNHKSTEDNENNNNKYNNSIMRIRRATIQKIANYYISEFHKFADVPSKRLIKVTKDDRYSNNKYYIKIGDTSDPNEAASLPLTFICRSFVPIRSVNNQPYTTNIASITRYGYDKENQVVRFLIGCSGEFPECSNHHGLAFRVMSFDYSSEDKKKMIVNISKSTTFFVDTSNVKYKINGTTYSINSSNMVFQDIFFGYQKGLYIPVWNSNTRTKSYIFRVRLANVDEEHSTNAYKAVPISSVTVFNRANTKYKGHNLTQYEIESLAFLKTNSNGSNASSYKIVLAANRAYGYTDNNGDDKEAGCDAYEILEGNNRGLLLP